MTEKLSIEEFYSEGAKNGRLLGLRCEKNHVTLPPRHSCMVCRSLDLSRVGLSGLGTIIEFTSVHSKSMDFPLDTPYELAIVGLEEGPNLLGVVLRGNSKEGARVKVTFKTLAGSERPRIFFELLNQHD